MTLPVRVVKVGGSLLGHQPEAQAKESAAPICLHDSLLAWTGLSAALKSWIARQSPAVHVLVAGGGELADAIRRADAAHGLGEEAAHWLCVDALTVTARLLGAIANAEVVTEVEELPSLAPAVCVFDPATFLRQVEPLRFSQRLPHTWAVTSDSIAARIAQHLAASELVLLKSCLPAAAVGYVDDHFPKAAAPLPHIRCVNLRSPNFEEITWASRP